MIRRYFKLLIVVGLIGFFSPASAQLNLTLDASQNFTNFKFTNSQGETDVDYKGKFLGAYDLGIKVDVYKDLYFRSSIGMRKVGASYITNKVNSEWDLQFMHIELGLVYQHEFEVISLFASVSPFYENLVKGNQRLLDINYDVVASNALNTTNFGLSYQGGII
ncbi:MAG: hypothetical protein KJP21_04635, partial [Bacteroidia bacterium]|nr:hypothetical protein [Bacteroidia bacterium]